METIMTHQVVKGFTAAATAALLTACANAPINGTGGGEITATRVVGVDLEGHKVLLGYNVPEAVKTTGTDGKTYVSQNPNGAMFFAAPTQQTVTTVTPPPPAPVAAPVVAATAVAAAPSADANQTIVLGSKPALQKPHRTKVASSGVVTLGDNGQAASKIAAAPKPHKLKKHNATVVASSATTATVVSAPIVAQQPAPVQLQPAQPTITTVVTTAPAQLVVDGPASGDRNSVNFLRNSAAVTGGFAAIGAGIGSAEFGIHYKPNEYISTTTVQGGTGGTSGSSSTSNGGTVNGATGAGSVVGSGSSTNSGNNVSGQSSMGGSAGNIVGDGGNIGNNNTVDRNSGTINSNSNLGTQTTNSNLGTQTTTTCNASQTGSSSGPTTTGSNNQISCPGGAAPNNNNYGSQPGASIIDPKLNSTVVMARPTAPYATKSTYTLVS